MVFPYLPFMMEFLIPRLREDHQSVGKLSWVLLKCDLHTLPPVTRKVCGHCRRVSVLWQAVRKVRDTPPSPSLPSPANLLLSLSLSLSLSLLSYMWGVLADKKGRKPVLLISNAFVAISTIAFGFSVNFGMAIATRALIGFFNGKQ